MSRLRAGALGAVLLALAGCATRPAQPPEAGLDAAAAKRMATVGAWSQWGLTARLGLDDGHDGGSGRLDWRVGDQGATLDFRGTLGRGAWRLRHDAHGAQLERADGSTVVAGSLADLVITETGLRLPVDALQWWVRGLPAPDTPHLWTLDDAGRPLVLEQAGWRVTYARWMAVESVELPRRLEATDGRQRVNLAISRWWHGAPGGDA